MNLYNIMRPRNFGELLPTCNSIGAIINDAKKGQLKHTYLFHGPRGCGKTTVAKLVGLAYDCLCVKEEGVNIPCGNCKMCQINRAAYTNIIEVNAGDFRKTDDMRKLWNDNRKKGLAEGTKVIIINEAHKLTFDARDVLLTPLETPPAHLKWILTTTEVNKLKQDLISRCQVHEFKRLTKKDTYDLVSRAVTKYNEVMGDVEGTVVMDSLSEKVYSVTDGIPRTVISSVETYISSGMKDSVLTSIEEEDNDALSPEERDRFTAVLDVIRSRNVVEASKVSAKLQTYSGNCEGIRLGLIKYTISRLSEAGDARKGTMLLKCLREPLAEIYPMRDLLCRLLLYIHDITMNNNTGNTRIL